MKSQQMMNRIMGKILILLIRLSLLILQIGMEITNQILQLYCHRREEKQGPVFMWWGEYL